MVEGTFTVRVVNSGDADLVVQLEATDPEEGCSYILEPPQLAVPAGQERPAQLKVLPRAPLSTMAPRRYTFTVSARPAEAPGLTRQTQGEWEQIPPSFELALSPLPDAAEGVLLTQWVLRNLAHQNGMRCSTDPMMAEGHAGNGLHFHFAPVKDGSPS